MAENMQCNFPISLVFFTRYLKCDAFRKNVKREEKPKKIEKEGKKRETTPPPKKGNQLSIK